MKKKRGEIITTLLSLDILFRIDFESYDESTKKVDIRREIVN